MCQHQPRCPQSRAPDHLAAPPWPVRWQWPPEVVMTLTMSLAKAQRAIRTSPRESRRELPHPARTMLHATGTEISFQ
jgi:hypothetical protein